ncbi:hypothetical protein R1flu_000718 [Riccia fluitans]|uniref:Beta-amylase n=1 Tax=Riccia fluitans TaxID=41844 RepID=A0ABD1Y198_9MARC
MIERKKCPFYFRMHALFGHRANIEPPALAHGGLPDDEGDELADGGLPDNEGDEEDVRNSANDGPFHSDVIPGINATTTSPVDLSEEEYEDDLIADRDGKVASGQTQSSLQHPKEDNNNRMGRNEGKRPFGHKSNLIHIHEESVQEKTQYRKVALDARESFREAMLTEKRMARAQKERIREVQDKENRKRAKVDRHAALLTELSKAGKSLNEIRTLFELLDCVEKAVDDVTAPSACYSYLIELMRARDFVLPECSYREVKDVLANHSVDDFTVEHNNQNNEVTDPESLKYDLRALKSVNVDGVMVDCWWGIVEGKAPQQYNWNDLKTSRAKEYYFQGRGGLLPCFGLEP